MTTISPSQTDTINISQSGNTIRYNINGGSNINITAWPVTIVNGTSSPTQNVKVIFTTDLTISTTTAGLSAATNGYFNCGTAYIQFGSTSLINGTRPTITISSLTDYVGFIRNNNGNIAYGNISIYNLIVDGTTSTLGANVPVAAGWVGGARFGYNVGGSTPIDNIFIINCSSKGPIVSNGGGIIGQQSAHTNSTVVIRGCSSNGNMTGNSAGGIVGSNSGFNSGGRLIIDQCTSSGTIGGGVTSGGICGSGAGGGTSGIGSATITNSYSTGDLVQQRCGGICGGGTGNVTVQNCYSTGNINAADCGGIFGRNAASVGGTTARAINCYSTGIIPNITGVGGIFAVSIGLIIATNCYTSGSRLGSTGGIYGGSTNDNLFGSNNYSEGNNTNGGVWNNMNATATIAKPAGLTGVTDNSVWVNYPTINLGFKLVATGTSPYVTQNINTDNTLVQTFSQSVTAGSNTSSQVGNAFSAFGIVSGNTSGTLSINTTTGVITSTSLTPTGVYTLLIYAVDEDTVTTFILTVIGAPILNVLAPSIPPCCLPNVCNANPQLSNYDNSVIINKAAGKAVDKSVENFYTGVASGGRTAHSQPIFKSYYDYMNYLQGKYK
jgi:hypothetical protein